MDQVTTPTTIPASSQWQVVAHGFEIAQDLLESDELKRLTMSLPVQGDGAVKSREGVYAVRNLLEIVPTIQVLANSEKVRCLAERVLGSDAVPVRGLLFDKTAEANWLVPWHQDLTICVKSRIEVPGYGPWSVKAGVPHVQPPIGVLQKMIAIRIHLDRCDESNGALCVLPGTHLLGRLSAEDIANLRKSIYPVSCDVDRGGALLMKPLLLHASSVSEHPSHRRVIHIEYASCTLEGGLEW
ncbi:MAG: phytanoyl-CoA dioxygenase family protein [Bryobacteraceae bacterium]